MKPRNDPPNLEKHPEDSVRLVASLDRKCLGAHNGAKTTAVQFDLGLDGFTYSKWGGTQHCIRGDWLVNNNGDVYTVDGETFARPYRAAGLGTYVKTTPIWAEAAASPGKVRTTEGVTNYATGDYLVYNEADGGDAYAVAKAEFERIYEAVD